VITDAVVWWSRWDKLESLSVSFRSLSSMTWFSDCCLALMFLFRNNVIILIAVFFSIYVLS